MIQAFPLKPVDPQIAVHPIEQRGFITVPFDYRHPDGDTIPVFYRLIPSYGSTPADDKKPIVVVINGGPGVPSHIYRPLDFDYAHLESPKNGPLNRFRYLLNSFRILIVDQRGTDGQSAPLNMDDPRINANGIAHYFSSDSQARDYLAVIEAVIPKEEAFFIIAQSYGGMVGMQYLSLPAVRKPKGIIFSCAAVPYADIEDEMLARRTEQLKLNKELKAAVPEIESKLAKLKEHLLRLELDQAYVHSLYAMLGKNVRGVWERDVVTQIERMLKQSRTEIENEIRDHLGDVSLLNYVLSSTNCSPGFTDRTLAKLTSEKIPFEPWMIDENEMLMKAGQDGTWREAFVNAIDLSPPPATPFASVEALRTAIATQQVLFIAADNDAFVPAECFLRSIEKFQVEGHTRIERLPGGHHAIFLGKGHELLVNWARLI